MAKTKSNFNVKDFTPLHDNVIVKPIKITNKDGYVRPQQEEDKSEMGTIIAIGLGLLDNTSKIGYLKVLRVGDVVLFNKYSTTKTDVDENLIVRFEDIVAVQKHGK